MLCLDDAFADSFLVQVDDDLPIIDRILHYTASQIALQRLVHVKMLAETAELAGYVTDMCVCAVDSN
jgi:hypothetical protein